jgi:hypothetical protein
LVNRLMTYSQTEKIREFRKQEKSYPLLAPFFHAALAGVSAASNIPVAGKIARSIGAIAKPGLVAVCSTVLLPNNPALSNRLRSADAPVHR